MNLVFDNAARRLTVDGWEFPAWSGIRNELNKLRPRGYEPGHPPDRPLPPDVCWSILRDGRPGPPTMPRPFPRGTWNVTGIIDHSAEDAPGPVEPYLYPYFIATDAWDTLDEWELDEHGFYAGPTGRKIEIGALGLHFSESRTTLGCIRVGFEADLRALEARVRPALAAGEEIKLEVI